MSRANAVSLLTTLLAFYAVAPAQQLSTRDACDCEPHWDIHAFPPGRGLGYPFNIPDFFDAVRFDTGSGPELFISGRFQSVGGVYSPGVAKWDGKTWIAVSWAMPPIAYDAPILYAPRVLGLEVFQSHTNVEVYAIGTDFNTNCEVMQPAQCAPGEGIIRYDGESWSDVAEMAVINPTSMTTYDSGSGPELYVAGAQFALPSDPGFATALARWDGTQWLTVSSQTPRAEAPNDIVVVNEPTGPVLYIAGDTSMVFNPNAVPVPDAQVIARWDGSQFSAVGEGIFSGAAEQIAVIDGQDGGHPIVFIRGKDLRITSGSTGVQLVQYDGAGWSEVPLPPDRNLLGIAVADINGAAHLYALSEIISAGEAIAEYLTEDLWIRVLENEVVLSPSHPALVALQEEQGAALLLNARIRQDEMGGFDGPVLWDGNAVDGLGAGLTGLPTIVRAIGKLTTEQDEFIFATGINLTADNKSLPGLVLWNGEEWHGLEGDAPQLLWTEAIFVRVNKIGGDVLYLASSGFTLNEDPTMRYVARFDGEQWTDVTAGLNREILAAAAYDDGSGEERIVVSGGFNIAGGAPTDYIAIWDGQQWQPLTDGDASKFQPRDAAAELTVLDNGFGSVLYAFGSFRRTTESGFEEVRAVRLEGAEWVPVEPQPIGISFRRTTVFNDGTGPAFYGMSVNPVGGDGFGLVGDAFVWKQTPAGWIKIGSGTVRITPVTPAMVSFDDGSGSGLYISSSFMEIDGVPARGIAKWDGQAWSALGEGVYSGILIDPSATTMFPDLHADPPALIVAGAFTSAGGAGAGHVAKWQGCAPDLVPNCPGDINGDELVNLDDFAILAANFGAGPGATPAQGDLNEDGFVNLADFNILAVHFGTNCTE